MHIHTIWHKNETDTRKGRRKGGWQTPFLKQICQPHRPNFSAPYIWCATLQTGSGKSEPFYFQQETKLMGGNWGQQSKVFQYEIFWGFTFALVVVLTNEATKSAFFTSPRSSRADRIFTEYPENKDLTRWRSSKINIILGPQSDNPCQIQKIYKDKELESQRVLLKPKCSVVKLTKGSALWCQNAPIWATSKLCWERGRRQCRKVMLG